MANHGLALAKRRSAGRGRLALHQRFLWWLADRLVFARVRARVGGRLEFAISGAAALPKEVAEVVDGLGIQVYEGYGLTEASPIVTANVPGHRKLGSVGRPLPGVHVVIDRAVAGVGSDGERSEGEIVVYGPNVMRGYHGRPDESQAAFTGDGGLRTGDLGYLDEDGYLFITGRIKEQYKLANGKYVSPAPLEDRLKLSPLIAEVMIHGEGRLHNVALVVPDLTRLCAAVRAAPDEIAGPAAVEQFLRTPQVIEAMARAIEAGSHDFRGYERIQSFLLLPTGFTSEDGTLTPSLKLKRQVIVARWRAEIDRLHASGPASAADADALR
jgi:long-chain acyl-CoA synthetase